MNSEEHAKHHRDHVRRKHEARLCPHVRLLGFKAVVNHIAQLSRRLWIFCPQSRQLGTSQAQEGHLGGCQN